MILFFFLKKKKKKKIKKNYFILKMCPRHEIMANFLFCSFFLFSLFESGSIILTPCGWDNFCWWIIWEACSRNGCKVCLRLWVYWGTSAVWSGGGSQQIVNPEKFFNFLHALGLGSASLCWLFLFLLPINASYGWLTFSCASTRSVWYFSALEKFLARWLNPRISLCPAWLAQFKISIM